jgi:hypothetical protein
MAAQLYARQWLFEIPLLPRGSAAGSLENPLIVSEVSLHAPHVLRIILAVDRIRP